DHRQSIQAGSITGILAAEFFCDPNGGLELVLRIRESVLLAQPSPFVHQFLPSRFGGSDLTRLETWRATSAGNPRTTIRGAIERRLLIGNTLLVETASPPGLTVGILSGPFAQRRRGTPGLVRGNPRCFGRRHQRHR